jgi:ribonuclease HI
MEIRAVIEALRILPEGMHVWISTDSTYIENGINDGWEIGFSTT